MELNDLKGVWAQYDKQLKENLRINEELLKKLNLDKSRREMNTPLNYEIISVVIAGLFLILVASWTIRFGNELVYLVSGILSCLSFSIMLFFSIQKVRLLSNMDYYNLPVVELQKALCRFKDQYFKLKKFDIILFPFYIVVMMPIFGKGLRNFDLLMHPMKFTIMVVIAIGIGLPVALWIYKYLYEKKIKNTTAFLNELSRFEEEK
jgi:hypothetical protein